MASSRRVNSNRQSGNETQFPSSEGEFRESDADNLVVQSIAGKFTIPWSFKFLWIICCMYDFFICMKQMLMYSFVVAKVEFLFVLVKSTSKPDVPLSAVA